MSNFSHASLKKHLNSEFQVIDEPGERRVLNLIRVSDIKNRGTYESYSIEFIGPKDRFLKQRIYELSHNSLGTHSVFLVPVGEGDKGYQYEAVFSRKTDSI
ncbi:MAG: hypothetical protein KKD44_10460 [Proteobacteria bacterium]|nr:hypothetical protein [Pseudomonadota bacterium]